MPRFTRSTARNALACLALLAAGPWASAQATLSDLRHWEGKYPSDIAEPEKRNLLQNPAVQAATRRILPREELKLFLSHQVESRVKIEDDFLIAVRCMPRNCAADFSMLVADMKQARFWVGLFSRAEARVSTRWYGDTEDYTVLPPKIRQLFEERQGK